MTQKELLELLDSWDNLNIIKQEAVNSSVHFDLLMEIALNHTKKRSWRAAYVVDQIHDNHPELVRPFLSKMVKKLEVEKNHSKKRHFLKLISMNEIQEKDIGFLFDFCMETLTSEEPPAVRVHAMQILYNISEKQPGLKPELLAVIQHEMEYHSTAGIISRGKRITRKLERQIRGI
jgi:hypothetical protein